MKLSFPRKSLAVVALLLSLTSCSAFQPCTLTRKYPVQKYGRLSLLDSRRKPSSFSMTKHDLDVPMEPPVQSANIFLRNWCTLVPRMIMRWIRTCRRKVTLAAIALVFAFACHCSAVWAVTGGRMGGSFKSNRSSSSPPTMRSSPTRLPPTSHRSYPIYSSPRIYRSAPRVVVQNYGDRGLYRSETKTKAATRLSPGELAVLTGTGIMIAYGVASYNKQPDISAGPLGRGVTVASLTVQLDVPNRDDPNSILNKLHALSLSADTSTRKGVQDLLSAVAIELLRQQKSIGSAHTVSTNYPVQGQAEREFHLLSVKGRSKVDRLAVNKFGSENRPDAPVHKEADPSNPRATSALVTINLAIEGDKTMLPSIRFRQDLLDSLSKIAADAQVEDCLLSAEILWSPEDRNEVLPPEDVIADYPELVPV